MAFEWDEEKNRRNIAERAISFERAVTIFGGYVLTQVDDRKDYGEIREITIGLLEGVTILVVVHTERDDDIRIISARRANRNERRLYNEEIRKRTDS